MESNEVRTRLRAERTRLAEVHAAASRSGNSVGNADGDTFESEDLPAEKANETIGRELDESVALHASEELEAIDAALKRLDDGVYGVCEVCGKPIGEGRLEALPATRYCVEDAEKAAR